MMRATDRQTVSRLRIAGNAVQPALLMFPLGLFLTVLILDVGRLLGAPVLVGTLAYWNLVAGLLGGAVVALAGGVDMFGRGHPRSARLAAQRLLLELGVLFAFAVLALLRVGNPGRSAEPGLVLLELLAVAAAGFSAWFGGRLGGLDLR